MLTAVFAMADIQALQQSLVLALLVLKVSSVTDHTQAWLQSPACLPGVCLPFFWGSKSINKLFESVLITIILIPQAWVFHRLGCNALPAWVMAPTSLCFKVLHMDV